MKIFKYTLELTVHQFVTMVDDAEILSVGLQNSRIVLWAKINPTALHMRVYEFYIIGTGNDVPQNTKYVGTLQQDDFVWHIFVR